VQPCRGAGGAGSLFPAGTQEPRTNSASVARHLVSGTSEGHRRAGRSAGRSDDAGRLRARAARRTPGTADEGLRQMAGTTTRRVPGKRAWTARQGGQCRRQPDSPRQALPQPHAHGHGGAQADVCPDLRGRRDWCASGQRAAMPRGLPHVVPANRRTCGLVAPAFSSIAFMMKPATNSLGLSVAGRSKERRVPYLDAVFGPSGVLLPDWVALANEIAALASAGGGVFALRIGAETEYRLAELVDRL